MSVQSPPHSGFKWLDPPVDCRVAKKLSLSRDALAAMKTAIYLCAALCPGNNYGKQLRTHCKKNL